MKKLKGFSLAEMMVVLLLISVVMAATAPMITKRVSRERTSNIFEKLPGDKNNAVKYIGGRDQRIFMNGKSDGRVGIVESGVDIPIRSVLFGNINLPIAPNKRDLIGIGFNTSPQPFSVSIGNDASTGSGSVTVGYNSKVNDSGVSIGYDAKASSESVAVGYNAQIGDSGSVAIGKNAKVEREKTMFYHVVTRDGVAIGRNSLVNTNGSIAIGYNAKALYKDGDGDIKKYQIAIGYNAKAIGKNSVAIGYKAEAPMSNTIVLGNEDTTVFIPGNLVVGKDTLLGWSCSETPINDHDSTCGRLFTRPSRAGEDGMHMAVLRVGDWKGGEDAGFYMARDLVVGPFDYAANKQFRYLGDYSDNNCYNAKTGWHGQCGDYSDIRLKDVGEDYTAGIEELLGLKFYHFTFKADENKTPHVGVMAQDLQKVFPDAVKPDKDGWLTIRWDEMFFATINAIKQLNEKIVTVVAEVAGVKELVQTNQKTIEAQAELITKQAEQIDLLTKRVEALELKLNEVK